MAPLIVRAEDDSTPEPVPAAELLDAIGLTAKLSERLALDVNGQSFEPVQLDPHQDFMQLVGLLLRREPIGGAEAPIRENERQFRETALAQVNRALAGAAHPTRALLQELIAEVRARNDLLAADVRAADESYAGTQERLHRWQEYVGRRSGSLGGDLLRWLFGGGDRLSLPEAVALWNRREHQAMTRAACAAALDLGIWLLDRLADLRGRLDALLDEARRVYAASVEQGERQRRASPLYAPWTLRIDTQAVVEALLAETDLEGLVAELLRRQAEAGTGNALADDVRELAGQEAGRRLAELGMAELIELEAGVTGVGAGEDPLILVGQALLDHLDRSSWRLVPGARPRMETIQVTPDGAPVYSLDGLSSAAYGDRRDRLGFVQVELGVAKDDLLLLRNGEEAFQAALRQRNLYVLEELARAWEAGPGRGQGGGGQADLLLAA